MARLTGRPCGSSRFAKSTNSSCKNWKQVCRAILDASATIWKRSREKRKELTAATTAAEQNATTVQQNLQGGVASQLEFRLIENTLLETKSALASLAFQQKVALAEWDRATGRYLQFSDDSARNVH